MIAAKTSTDNKDDKEWENPLNPEAPKDARDKEQAKRLYEEAQRQKNNLSEESKKEKN
jgi:hypothetical protein